MSKEPKRITYASCLRPLKPSEKYCATAYEIYRFSQNTIKESRWTSQKL